MRSAFFPLALAALLISGCRSANKIESPEITPRAAENSASPTPESNPESATSVSHATLPPKRPLQKKIFLYSGIRGFLSRPPLFIDAESQAAYDRCSPIEILAQYERNGQILLAVKQNDRTLWLSGLNRKSFVVSRDGKLPLLDRHLALKLDVLETRRPAKSGHRACTENVWRDMSVEEFQFIAGDPEFRQKYISGQTQFDVWTYIGTSRSKARHYYFHHNRLYSWTNP